MIDQYPDRFRNNELLSLLNPAQESLALRTGWSCTSPDLLRVVSIHDNSFCQTKLQLWIGVESWICLERIRTCEGIGITTNFEAGTSNTNSRNISNSIGLPIGIQCMSLLEAYVSMSFKQTAALNRCGKLGLFEKKKNWWWSLNCTIVKYTTGA